MVAAVAIWWLVRDDSGPESSGFVFEGEEVDAPSDRLVVPDVVDARLVDRVDLPVVVASGSGEEHERIVEDPDPEILPVAPGDVVVALVRAGGEGRVVLTGPSGWLSDVCVVASITSGLVPLDIVQWQSGDGCAPALPGRPAEDRCLGDQTIVFAIDVPQEPVDLPTGGTGVAEALRVQLIGSVDGYDVVSIRGRVDVADLAVDVPVLSGGPGEVAEFELGGAGARVSCTFR